MNEIKKYLWSFKSLRWDLLLIILCIIDCFIFKPDSKTEIFIFSSIHSLLFLVKDFIEDEYIRKFIKK